MANLLHAFVLRELAFELLTTANEFRKFYAVSAVCSLNP